LGFCGFELGEREGELPELGFGYSETCWGIGVGYEAAIAAVDWFFRRGKFKEFYACTDSFNTGSLRILEKLGMRYHGDEDLWDSVAKGEGLVPVYLLDREVYLTNMKIS
jgi:RimJ/RimL family protein N-acetyltransferase